MTFRSTILCGALMLGALACDDAKPANKAEAAPAESEADKAVAAVDAAPPEQRAPMAAQVLGTIGKKRLPKAIVKALDAIATVDPANRSLMAAASLTSPEGMKLADAACGKRAATVLKEVTKLEHKEGAKLLFKECDLGRHKLLSAAEAEKANPVLLLVAHCVLVGLGDKAPESERKLVRALLP